MEEPSDLSKGGSCVKAAQEILCARDPVSGGSSTPTDLISIQPPPAGVSQEVPQHPKKPTCPPRGLAVPDRGVAATPPRRPQASSLSVHSSRSRGKQPEASQSDSCFQLLLACLWCQCSALILGLLGACSSCLHALCASCCRACARCCSAVQEVPVEELSCHAHCHSVLFESCCEPTECLEFCLECCEICHRS